MKALGLRAPQHNQIQPDVRAAHYTPVCKVWNSVGEAGHGPGGAVIGWDQIEYDNDGMTKAGVAGGALTVKTSGIYWFKTHHEFTGVAAVVSVWDRIVINGNPAAYLAGRTDQVANTNTFGFWLECEGMARLNKGEYVQPFTYTDTPININGGQAALWFSAHFISSR